MVRYGTCRTRQQQGDVVELLTNLKGGMIGSAFGSTRGAWLGNPAPSAPASLSSEAQPWGFTTALFEFYWGRCGVVGATCSGTVAFAHTPALPGSDELQSRPDLHNGPFLLSQTSPRPTAVFSGFSAANGFKALNAKKSPDMR
jgi:hypothetical protein